MAAPATLPRHVLSVEAGAASEILLHGRSRDLDPDRLPYRKGDRVEVLPNDTLELEYGEVVSTGVGNTKNDMRIRLDRTDDQLVFLASRATANICAPTRTFSFVRLAGNCSAMENGRRYLRAWVVRPPGRHCARC